MGLGLWNRVSADDLAIHIEMTNIPLGRVSAIPLVLPHKLQDALERTDVQVDMIWGEFDQPHPDPGLQWEVLRRQQPDAELRVIANAGHWSIYDDPQASNAALLELLAKPLRKG